MKTTIEVSGFEIKIEEMDGKIMVSAMKDEEVVEEFELESEEMEGGEDFGDDEMEGDDDMSAFGEEDMEEEQTPGFLGNIVNAYKQDPTSTVLFAKDMIFELLKPKTNEQHKTANS